MMPIEQLRHELKRRSIYYVVKYINKDDAEEYQLSTNNPANVNSSGEIFILDSLNEKDKNQAEAHELGHLYIRELGLVQVISQGYGRDYRILEINNALSHRFVTSVLSDEFGISNENHLTLRAESIKNIQEEILESPYDSESLHGIGVKLYDISVTLPKLTKEVEGIVETNGFVCEAYNAAHRHFDAICCPSMPKKEQEDAIGRFFDEIGVKNAHKCV